MASTVDEIIVASPDDGQQKEIKDFCRKESVRWIEGHCCDLPERLEKVAEYAKNEKIIVLTGDLPFLSWEGMDNLFHAFGDGFDYGNTIDGISPYLDGTNCEIITKRGIERQAKNATYGRCHACIWIRQEEWEKKLTVDAPRSCETVAHLPVMVDDWSSYFAVQFIHTMLNGQTSYRALLNVMEKERGHIERILSRA